MDARAEASERIGGRYEPRVLEPSPPAMSTPPWFADDPLARGEVPAGRQVVSPIATGDVRWEQMAAEDEGLGQWCAQRWLGPYRRLGNPPAALVATRIGLRRLGEHVISPARRKANGKIGLRYTRGGFGTPFFGDDIQVRVESDELIVDERGRQRGASITSLTAAAEHIGRELLPDDAGVDGAPLDVDHQAASFLGEWYGFAASVLEALRSEAGPDADPSRVQLWPEHFDLALELGREDASARAAYGLSPGDEQHPEPYAYVAPWVAPPAGELWQAPGFTGAELSYAELADAPDQREAALRFFRLRVRALAGSARRDTPHL